MFLNVAAVIALTQGSAREFHTRRSVTGTLTTAPASLTMACELVTSDFVQER